MRMVSSLEDGRNCLLCSTKTMMMTRFTAGTKKTKRRRKKNQNKKTLSSVAHRGRHSFDIQSRGEGCSLFRRLPRSFRFLPVPEGATAPSTVRRACPITGNAVEPRKRMDEARVVVERSTLTREALAIECTGCSTLWCRLCFSLGFCCTGNE